jgi:hypothetical protein
MLDGEVAEVDPQRGRVSGRLAHDTPFEEVDVFSDDVVARSLEQGDEDGTNIPIVTGDKDLHVHSFSF